MAGPPHQAGGERHVTELRAEGAAPEMPLKVAGGSWLQNCSLLELRGSPALLQTESLLQTWAARGRKHPTRPLKRSVDVGCFQIKCALTGKGHVPRNSLGTVFFLWGFILDALQNNRGSWCPCCTQRLGTKAGMPWGQDVSSSCVHFKVGISNSSLRRKLSPSRWHPCQSVRTLKKARAFPPGECEHQNVTQHLKAFHGPEVPQGTRSSHMHL